MKKFAVCLCLAVAAWCQVDRGAIVGTVSDPAGGVLVRVEVLVRNVDTNVVFQTRTDDAGAYVAPDLSPGAYEVTARMTGFKQRTIGGVTVGGGQRVRADFSMEIGNVSEQVSVTAQAALVETESATLGTAISRQTITDLPLNGRSFIDLLPLSSGIIAGTPGRLLNGRGVQTARGSSAFSNNGMRDTSNNFLIDGIQQRHGCRHHHLLPLHRCHRRG
jgi:hypothetical protein